MAVENAFFPSGRFFRAVGTALVVLGTTFLLAPPASAQSALEQLRRILGGGSSESRRPERPSERPSERPGGRREHAGDISGSIGVIDYAKVFRLHPLMRNLHVSGKAGVAPTWVRARDRRTLHGHREQTLRRREAEKKLRGELASLEEDYQREMRKLNAMPGNVGAVLRRLPRRTPPEVRKLKEEEFFATRRQRQERVRRLRAAVSELQLQLQDEPLGASELERTYLSAILAEIDETLDEVVEARSLGLVLHIPSRVSSRLPQRPNVRPAPSERNANFLNEFLDAPARGNLDDHLLGGLLHSWERTTERHDDLLPAHLEFPEVLHGGVRLEAPVLTRIWRKHGVDEQKIRILKDYLVDGISEGQ